MAFRKMVQSSHFFKVILKSTLEDKKLIIPENFARIFGDELSAVATLTTSNGQVWQVRLTKAERNILFDDGWHDFVQYHSINVGYFLVFKYKKNSNFKVLILDLTASEIQCPCGEDTDEMMHFTTPKPASNSLKAKAFDKCPRSSSKVQPQPSQQNPAKHSFASLGTPKLKCGYDKRRKMEEPEEKDKPTAEDKDKDEMLILLEDMRICVNKNFGSIAAEEKEEQLLLPDCSSLKILLSCSYCGLLIFTTIIFMCQLSLLAGISVAPGVSKCWILREESGLLKSHGPLYVI